MLRLSRAALALLLATWTTVVAAAPPCADDGGCAGETAQAADGAGDSHGDGCGTGPDAGCAACPCCGAPVTPPRAWSAVEPVLVGARVLLASPDARGAGDYGEIFQPPKA